MKTQFYGIDVLAMSHYCMYNMYFLKNFANINMDTTLNCKTCAEGKQSKLPFTKNGTRAKKFCK